jgi:hypothetical protein
MPHLNALAILAIGAALGSAAARAGDAVDESRQAIRCATVYKLMAEMPDIPEADRSRLSGLKGLMVDIYMRNNQDTSNAITWGAEFSEEIKKYSDGTDPEFMSREMVVCDALLKKEAENNPNLSPASPDQPK